MISIGKESFFISIKKPTLINQFFTHSLHAKHNNITFNTYTGTVTEIIRSEHMSIELKNIAKTYDNKNWILKDINTKIETGEFFAIVGPSGCGKSTLLRMIAGLIPISSGDLQIDNRSVINLPPRERNLTMVFQDYALFPFLDVEANVGFGLKARKMPELKIKKRVAHALELVDLTALKTRKPRELSGGQRQRVALARAIASDAKICLMDEPLSNLDAQLRGKMRSEIRELQQRLGLTLIYVTHDQIEAMTMADRIMVLNNQQVQQVGSPLDIYQHPSNSFVGTFFGTPQMNILKAHCPHTHNQQLIIDPFLTFQSPLDLPAGDYFVGVRPVDFDLTTHVTRTNAFVRSVEYLGNEFIIYIKLDDSAEIRVVTSEKIDLNSNERVLIRPKNKFFIFDHSGKTISFMKGVQNNGRTSKQETQAIIQ
ncbi:SN-glycerol-3-phosphate ABC superfamily ATP binding cassette transporter, ABC protein [Liquorilactobacillus aquaticus DSM 21051]|uniref:SN-glycerol-3-phosphate ABC superfamily ATP binding cassette transporter, ABC protein n=2 Tax=Liquorilactobacillus aquaticus TaxID=392566 RepID=A0A0R2D152_9LACO|nr:SN-glycerol-3-phosphate ABC superfamily ATP binding cassette transporter, ABC protein [Liquorilactobacillus aquaticus DSM 21051]